MFTSFETTISPIQPYKKSNIENWSAKVSKIKIKKSKFKKYFFFT